MKIRLPWMSRADRTQRQAARTLAGLGRLTAARLEGGLQSRPGYQPQYAPDDETLPYVQILATANRTAPHPPAPAPTVLCTACGCTAIDWQICGDGCSGVTNQPKGLCDACIDPSVIIDWSKEPDAAENKCALCGAPYYAARRYCSDACESADNPEHDDDSDTPVPAQLPRLIPVHTATDPWS